MAKKTEATSIAHAVKAKKVFIPVAIIAVLLIIIAVVLVIPKGAGGEGAIKTEQLTLRNLSNTISTTGMVESINKANVYSQQSNPVKTIFYSVGDTVQEGDVLCELDTESLLLDIAQQQATINASAQSAQHQINTSEKNYKYTQQVNNEDLDASVRNSRNLVSDTREKFEDADEAYDNRDSALASASTAVSVAKKKAQDCEQAKTAAQTALSNAQKALDDAVTIGSSDIAGLTQAVTDAQTALTTASQNLVSANSDYTAAFNSYDEKVTAYETAEDTRSDALRAYNDAQKGYEGAVLSADKNLESAKDSVTGSQISANNKAGSIALEKLNLQLEKSTLRAPISGTVTAVYATEGAPGNGLLFVIEDTDSLKISTSVKEYDTASVKSGLPVTIRSDATGDKEFSGVVSKIAPTAAKASDGTTITGTNVQFDTEIAVTGDHDGLRVGMNTRLNIVLEERKNVFGVPYDAVVTDEKGSSIVYIAQQDAKGAYTAKAVPVTIGLETDFYLEIAGDGLSKNALIITNPGTVTDGAKVQVQK